MTDELARKISQRIALVTSAALVASGLAACSTTLDDDTATAESALAGTSSELWDSSTVHDIEVEIADADYDAIIAAYLDSGEKEWGIATVTIDGTVFENVGIKLKGNSTLRAVTEDADPATLPWLIDLDKYVDGQEYDGTAELVVRGNSTETGLNEALALELLEAAGLASEQAVSSRFTVNDGTTALRLVIENPDDLWVESEFSNAGLLYKAEAGGDWTYRGDDPASYADVFDQQAGDDDLTPLIEFLQFINESDDATFAADLDEYLDVEAFATYLAFQDLVDNFDDIDGPGNNSYLFYDATSGQMTVVNWDLNLAFGTANIDQVGGGQRPAGGGGGARPGGGRDQSNVLADRFLENPEFAALVTGATADLQASLFASGEAAAALDDWVATLAAQASDLVDAGTIESEAAALRSYLD